MALDVYYPRPMYAKKSGIFVESMDKRLITILRKLQEDHGPEKGLAIFEQTNDQAMITIEQATEKTNAKFDNKFDNLRTEMKAANEKLQSEISQTKWILAAIGLAIAVINFLAKKG